MVIKKSIYSTHPSIAHWHAMLQSLPDRTGKTMEEWLALLHKSGLESVSERRKWLKEKHGLGLSTIGLILDEDEHKSPLPYLKPETLVDQIFSGAVLSRACVCAGEGAESRGDSFGFSPGRLGGGRDSGFNRRLCKERSDHAPAGDSAWFVAD
jgi:hypothetical protein